MSTQEMESKLAEKTVELKTTKESLGKVVLMNSLLLQRIAKLEQEAVESKKKEENEEQQQNVKELNESETDEPSHSDEQEIEEGGEESETEERTEEVENTQDKRIENADFETNMWILVATLQVVLFYLMTNEDFYFFK